MPSLSFLMTAIRADEDDDLGAIDQVENHRWIIGGGDAFPIQIEELVGGQEALIYATAMRETSEPVYLPMMITLFIEGLNGHSLGNYGICPGPVTLTVYQKVALSAHHRHDRLKAHIACHRLLIECFLDTGYSPPDDLSIRGGDGVGDQPIVPFLH